MQERRYEMRVVDLYGELEEDILVAQVGFLETKKSAY